MPSIIDTPSEILQEAFPTPCQASSRIRIETEGVIPAGQVLSDDYERGELPLCDVLKRVAIEALCATSDHPFFLVFLM
jgi:hypothetical protein